MLHCDQARKYTLFRYICILLFAALTLELVAVFYSSPSTTDDTDKVVSSTSLSEEVQVLKKELRRLDSEISSIRSSQLSKVENKRREVGDLFPPPTPMNGRKQVATGHSTHRPSSHRLAPFVNENYVRHKGKEWSFDSLERQYKSHLANARYPRLNDSTSDSSILFIDGREQCENARGFLVSVRQSGFQGKIVLLVYYLQDEAACQPLAEAFKPMIIFYRDTPMFEPTMLQYYGIVNYAKAFPEDRSLRKAIVVKPEAVFWCNRTNPFDDVPASNNIDNIFGVIGRQSDIQTYKLKVRDPLDDECFNPQGRWNGTNDDIDRKQNVLVDSFIAASNLKALIKLATTMVEEYSKYDLDAPKASFDLFYDFRRRADDVARHIQKHLLEMTPTSRYTVADCHRYLPENSACLTCERATVVVGTAFCIRRVTYDVPNYTPYCHQPYRNAIMEVPHETTMVTHAYEHIIDGAHMIRDKPGGIFKEPADTMRSVSAQCPHGVMGILSMMAGYTINKVHRFIGSYLSHADPLCVKLIMIIKPGLGLESVGKHFPDRVEYVLLNESSEFYPVKMKDCQPADSRFEVAQRWLEKNYHLYRYIMAPDSRDYTWQADPLAQLIKILHRQGFADGEFAGSVAEPFVVGGQTYPSVVAANKLRRWIVSCGKHCYRKMSKLKYTNGEPLAILNSGHIIGTSVGLLHYFRFHVRMMNESGHKCDNTDQGLFTYYMYGMLQEAHFPHKVLVFSSSRSGFANMPPPTRMSKRLRSDSPNITKELENEYYNTVGLPSQDRYDKLTVNVKVFKDEYSLTDCDNNIITGLHQFDRHANNNFFIDRSPNVWKPWVPWHDNQTFSLTFGKPKY